MNCCAELRSILDSGPDGGACPPVGSCREFEGNCADIMEQFADVPVLPDFPDGMSTYFCTQFPDDEQPFDSFIVGLISIAVAIPVTYLLQICFEIGACPRCQRGLSSRAYWRACICLPQAMTMRRLRAG